MRRFAPGLAVVALVVSLPGKAAFAAELPSGWQYQQQFSIAEAGLIKFSLPLPTIDAARPGFEDLRLYDSTGREVPYLLQRSAASSKASSPAQSFSVSLQDNATVVTLETGVSQPVDAVTLETPANTFVKAVLVEGSRNNRAWQKLAEGVPIFRQPGGVDQLHIPLSKAAWPFLRFTIDDRRSAPIPFTGARIHGIGERAPTEPVEISIGERQENEGETRLKLNLPAANLKLASIRIVTPEQLFMRRATVAAPAIAEGAIHERAVAQGVLYRVAVDDRPAASNFSVTVETQIAAREVFLVVDNQDSPPLPIPEVTAEHRPVYLTFLAKSQGRYHLLSGNRQCAAPHYDLASFGDRLKETHLVSVDSTARQENPAYRPAEALPAIRETGAELDVSAWTFRKPVECGDGTAQQLELDPDVLAQAASDLRDVRLVREGRHTPYVLERAPLTRVLSPQVAMSNDARNPKLSRWVIRLSHPRLPVTRLVCSSPAPLFSREMVLYENLDDERGRSFRHVLAHASWTRTPEQQKDEFRINVDGRIGGDALILETDNGDNPAIQLEGFKIHYPVIRLLFKAKPGELMFLYYGNHDAAAPRYDLGLVADQLLRASKAAASLGRQEQLRKSASRAVAGKAGPVFWIILAVVVIVLLVIVARLLPKPA